jgi:hypothetical protein
MVRGLVATLSDDVNVPHGEVGRRHRPCPADVDVTPSPGENRASWS